MESPVSIAFATAPDGEDFESDEPPEERDDALRDASLAEREDRLAAACEPEPFDLLLLCPLRDADLLLAIPDALFGRRTSFRGSVPALYAHNRNLRVSREPPTGCSQFRNETPRHGISSSTDRASRH
jgi:hypothetical protein